MVALQRTNQKITNANIVQNYSSIIMVGRKKDATAFLLNNDWWREDKADSRVIHYTKYQIKETDMRIKTATFSSPQYFDLTTGLWCVLITSPYHEDFAGVILKVKENEDTKEYDYQCQDFSRLHLSKLDLNFRKEDKVYDYIRRWLTDAYLPLKPTAKQLNKYKKVLSGLRPAHWYDQSLWGSTIKFNPMIESPKFNMRGVSVIEFIRGIFFGQGAYVDIYFDKYGVCQIEPYHKDDWLRRGLHLYPHELASRTPEFDTTNVITHVTVSNADKGNVGNEYTSLELLNLRLSVFFGIVGGYVQNPNEAKTTTTTTTAKKTSTTGNKDNPYGNKKKKVWIDADSGSCGTRNALANALRKKGWGVHVGGCGPNYHYSDYFRVSSDYQCLITIYNGFCAGTIREAYSSYIQNTLKKKGVVLIPCFITNTWTNPRGMAPYKYGDFSGYHARRAWDDNFSGSDPSISNVGTFFKNNNAKYLCYPNINGLVTQFLAGGYFEWKKKGGR